MIESAQKFAKFKKEIKITAPPGVTTTLRENFLVESFVGDQDLEVNCTNNRDLVSFPVTPETFGALQRPCVGWMAVNTAPLTLRFSNDTPGPLSVTAEVNAFYDVSDPLPGMQWVAFPLFNSCKDAKEAVEAWGGADLEVSVD